MKTVIIFSFVFVLSTIQGKLLGDKNDWNDLRVTFGINPLNTWNFDSLPRDASGNMQSFTLMDDQCAVGGKYLGTRYWYKNDPATILLFDKNGYIAGIQTVVPKSSGWVPKSPLLGTWVQEDSDSYSMTVYFVDPSTICTTGRSPSEFAAEGTGTGLYIQNGPDPVNNIFNVPALESDIKATKWGSGKCFWLMGQHYWFNVTTDMACENFVPYCLLYNDGYLNAFCFQIEYDVTPSKRYEHPTPKQAAACCLDPVPKCMDGTASTQHVFLTSNYLANHC